MPLAIGGDDPPSRYQRPRERAAAMRRRHLARDKAEAGRKLGLKRREASRKDALHGKAMARRDRERDRDYGLVADAYGGGPTGAESYAADAQREEIASDQRESDRRAQDTRDRRHRTKLARTLRPSDDAIVKAHRAAYGGYHPDHDTGEELASNE